MPPPLPDAQRGLAASLQARLRQRAQVLRPPRSGGFLARHGKGPSLCLSSAGDGHYAVFRSAGGGRRRKRRGAWCETRLTRQSITLSQVVVNCPLSRSRLTETFGARCNVSAPFGYPPPGADVTSVCQAAAAGGGGGGRRRGTRKKRGKRKTKKKSSSHKRQPLAEAREWSG